MAARKYDWGDGKGLIHTITLAAHQANQARDQNAGAAIAQYGAQYAMDPTNKQPGGVAINGKMVTPQQWAAGALLPPGTQPGPTSAASVGAAGTPATTPAATQIVPDAAYLARAAQAAFTRTTRINQLADEAKNDDTDTRTTINRLIENAAGDRAKINEGANKEGLFYSAQLTKRLGDYERELTRSQDDVTSARAQRQAARDAARAALEQGAPLDDAVELADAVTRQVTRDTTAADLGALVPNVNAGPGSTAVPAVTQAAAVKQLVNRQAGSPRAGQSFTVQQGRGGVWHIYSNGKRVWVPKRR